MTTKLKFALREVATLYDTPAAPHSALFDCGICFAVRNVSHNALPYSRVNALLDRAQEGWDGTILAPYTAHAGWEARAFMCLLLAHWLEDEGY